MIVSPDKNGQLDGPVCFILKEIQGNIPLIPVTFYPGYQFNEELYKLDRYVLFDFCEYGWDWDMQTTHIWGYNSHKFHQTGDPEWQRFDKFVKNNPPVAYFKRELLQKDLLKHFLIRPIEYPSFHPVYPTESEKEFNSRPIQVFFSWGHSHETRRILHGNIFVNAALSGYGVVDNFNFIEQAKKEYKDLWVTINVPHYARISMEEVLHVNGQAKLSVSLPGAGVKCFRHSESPVNSVMVMRDDNLAWTYPWIRGDNCIKILDYSCNGISPVQYIEAALKRNDLYEIYLNGLETLDKYRLSNYVKNYLQIIINQYQ